MPSRARGYQLRDAHTALLHASAASSAGQGGGSHSGLSGRPRTHGARYGHVLSERSVLGGGRSLSLCVVVLLLRTVGFLASVHLLITEQGRTSGTRARDDWPSALLEEGEDAQPVVLPLQFLRFATQGCPSSWNAGCRRLWGSEAAVSPPPLRAGLGCLWLCRLRAPAAFLSVAPGVGHARQVLAVPVRCCCVSEAGRLPWPTVLSSRPCLGGRWAAELCRSSAGSFHVAGEEWVWGGHVGFGQ